MDKKLKPKAYVISEEYNDYSVVVFADKPSKAKFIALSTDEFGESDYVNLRARRLKIADKLCRGRDRMYWDDPKDRLFLIKNCGWQCVEVDESECEYCPGKKHCDTYNRNRQEY